MDDAQMKQDLARVLFTPEQIKSRVKELGQQISRDFAGEEVVLVGILKGAVIFFADLAREISLPVRMDFMAISSYGSATKTSGVVRILKDLDKDITGRNVIIVEDIVDSGMSLAFLKENLISRGAKALRVCVLLDKPEGAIYPADVERLYSLYIFDDGMATDGGDLSQPVDQAEEGTATVSSLADLGQLPELTSLYYMADDPALLDTLGQLPQLRELIVMGENVNVPDFSFVSGMPKLLHISARVAAGADLSGLEDCVTLQRLLLWSEGSLALNAGKLTGLLELDLTGNVNGMQPESACVLELDQPLPQLLSLTLHGGELPSLDFLTNTPALQGLDLYGNNLGQLDLGPIGSLEQLRAVSLMISYDQSLDLAPLANCPALEVYLAPNGAVLNPPPQAVTDTDDSLPLYNGVMWNIQDEIYAQQME